MPQRIHRIHGMVVSSANKLVQSDMYSGRHHVISPGLVLFVTVPGVHQPVGNGSRHRVTVATIYMYMYSTVKFISKTWGMGCKYWVPNHNNVYTKGVSMCFSVTTRRLCVLANTKLYHRNLLLCISMKF